MTPKEKEALLKEATQRLGEYLLEKKRYLFHIDDVVTKVGNGIVKLELRVYNGFVTDVVYSETKRIPIKDYGKEKRGPQEN